MGSITKLLPWYPLNKKRMPDRYQRLIDELNTIGSWDEFCLKREEMADQLVFLQSDFEKSQFKYLRANKEKNILSSLLSRTTIDLKKVTERLIARAEELTTLLSTIPAFVYFKDLNLNYILVNKAFEELVGLGSQEILGKKVHDVFHVYNNPEYLDKEHQVLETGETFYNAEEEFEYNHTRKWVNTNLAPIRDANHQITGLIGFSWDITTRKQYEEELRNAKDLAEAGTQAKNEFIASVSHEFRTPMNGILGLSEILKNTHLENDQIELLKGITTSAENLLVLLNDVLDFSAIEAGKLEIDHQPFQLLKVMDDIAVINRLKANEKSLMFDMQIDERIPKVLVGDAARLRQIVLNLTNNAVKFTEKGSVTVKVDLIGSEINKIGLKFSVIDTGPGIPEKSLSSLFQVFSRLKQDKSRLIAGTGLGLSICKKLTDLMGGEIGVNSSTGKGSEFWFTILFTLPVTEPVLSNKSEGQVNTMKYRNNSVLLAEDNLINQKIAKFQLLKMGFDVHLASNGYEAFQLYQSHDYHLIILDIQMPVMDGYQAARSIRELEKNTGRHTPVIALTANAMKGDREIYLNAGMDAYISKPFTFEVLYQTIEALLG